MNVTKLLLPCLLFKDGLVLFFILLGSAVSKRIFRRSWEKYNVMNIPPTVFNLCVNWLLYKGNKYGISYEKINVLIFCIMWPMITVVSLILNVLLITTR